MAADTKFNMVAEEGNRRTGGMDKTEIRQCALDIATWFKRNSDMSVQPMDMADIENLERDLGVELPLGLTLFMEQAGGGGIWFYEKEMLPAESLAKRSSELDSGCVPFASDVDSNLYVVDTGNKDAVYEWDDDGRGDKVASNFEDFLEKFRNDLLSGSFEFVEDCGVVEGMSGGGNSKGNGK